MSERHWCGHDRLPDENYQPRHGRRGNEHHWWPDSGFTPIDPKAVGLDQYKQRKDPAPFRMKDRVKFMTKSKYQGGDWVFNIFTGTVGELKMRTDAPGEARCWTVTKVEIGAPRSFVRTPFGSFDFYWEEWEFMAYHPESYVAVGMERGWARTVEGNFQ